jgi:two-component system NarL family response regulator
MTAGKKTSLKMTIGVAIVEKQRMLRELLASVLSRETDIRIVGEAGTGAQAISMTRECPADVLLLNIALPDMNGMEVARLMQHEAQPVKLIALSEHAEWSIVYGMLEAGAMGYVVKSAAADEVVQAIRVVSAGGLYLSRAIASQAYALERFGPPVSVLGRREQEVLTLLAEGKHSREIAERLDISAATVEVHRRNIMHKLELHTVAQLTKYAIRKGLTSL